MPRRPPRRFPWVSLPDEELLQLRLKDLKVTLEGTWLESCLEDLHDELAERGLRIRPHAWISDEWFSPDDTPGIAIPFYLAHPRLMRLERKMILDVEGGTVPECMRILRHEAGHVVAASRFSCSAAAAGRSCSAGRRPAIPTTIGRIRPASNYVQHLRLWYAQSHPDEDFAETFAVWLAPRSNWRKRYAGWPALKKLRICRRADGRDRRRQAAAHAPAQGRSAEPAHQDAWPSTTRRSGRTTRSAIADDLRPRPAAHLLATIQGIAASPAASAFIRRNRARIRQMVSKWTGEYQLTLDAVFDDMIAPLPRAEAARGRHRAAVADGLHRAC